MEASRQPDLRPGFGARLAGFARWTLLFAVAAAALLVVGGTLAYQHLDEEIRQHVEQKFRLHYASHGLVVHIGSARRVEGKGIELRDIRLVQSGHGSADALVAYIGEGFVSCRTDLQDILGGDLQVGHVTVRRLKIRATRESDGTWNARRLFPLPQFSDCPPLGTIEDAVVEIVDSADEQERVLTLREVNLQLAPEACEECETDSVGARSVPALRVKGSFAGDHVDRITVDGYYNPGEGFWSLQGTAEGLRISPALRDSTPREAAAALAPLAGLRGQLRLDYRVVKQLEGNEPAQFEISGALSEGQIEDARLPDPLTDIKAQVYCDNHGLKIDRMTAKCGLGIVDLTCRRDGFAADSPLVLKAQARQIELDARLAKSLPPALKAEWDKLNPSGEVHLELSLRFDGRRWRPDLKIDCVDVSFAYYQFPYRLTGGIGTIHLKDDTLTVRLKALAAGQLVKIEGEIQNPGPNFTGTLSAVMLGPVPIDDALLAALDEKSRLVVKALRPRGSVTCQGRFEQRREQGRVVPRLRVEISLHDCGVKYEKFRYPLERISGTLIFADDRWTFQNLEGHNDSAFVTCNGSWNSAKEGGLLKLDFVATDVPLEDELQRALNPEAQHIWTQMRPHGTVDHLKVGMTYSSTTEEFGLTVVAQKWKKQQNLEGRGISIEPSWFPYRLDQVTGLARYRNGEVTFSNMTGLHGATALSLSGKCDFGTDGRWRVLFERFTADRVRCDHDLLAALPAELRGNVARLSVTGSLNVQGGLEIKGNSQTGAPPQMNWDTTLDMENGSLECGVKLEHVHGGVRLIGGYNGKNVRTRGEIEVDSLVHKEMQFTGISGPLWLDGSQIVLGARADVPRLGTAPRQVTAKFYGGALAADAQVSLGGDGEFDVQATLADADLKVLSRELIRGQRQLAGTGFGSVRLSGNNRGSHTWRGAGTLRLRDADIYEVPVMLALLKLLSIRRPNTTAFNNSDIDFRIQGDRFYFDRLDFKGDAITLKGNGEMDLDRNLNLQFYTLVGRDELRVPIITPVLGLASQQLLLIEVTGSVDNPELNKKAFPGLNDTLKQLFPEAQEAKNWNGLLPRR